MLRGALKHTLDVVVPTVAGMSPLSAKVLGLRPVIGRRQVVRRSLGQRHIGSAGGCCLGWIDPFNPHQRVVLGTTPFPCAPGCNSLSMYLASIVADQPPSTGLRILLGMRPDLTH
jgi:hypothetical protein